MEADNMKLNTNGKQAYKLVKALATARRNNNIKSEQKAYDNLYNWCNDNNTDMTYVINNIKQYMLAECIADCMNGLESVI
jgi:hypothetical protein